MIVVSDTTPLISLMKTGPLDLVEQLFGEIQIPEAVFHELISNRHFPEEIKMVQESAFIKKVMVEDVKAVELLCRSTGLDLGESEAIVLSDSNGAKGRKVAKQMGIQLMGTIGMLLVAYKEDRLTKEEILECLEALRHSGRHISSKLYEQLLQKLAE